VRELADEWVAQNLPALTGKVIELGALGDGRRTYAHGASEYIVTNIGPGCANPLDASNMDLPDESVDGFLCESMLEHVADPQIVVAEIRRVLRPRGKLLILTPWMYPFHAAPDDFMRFSAPALARLLDGFKIVRSDPLGNFWTTVATFAQLKAQPWRHMSRAQRAARIVAGAPLTGVGLASYAASRVFKEHDDFAPMYAIFAEKN